MKSAPFPFLNHKMKTAPRLYGIASTVFSSIIELPHTVEMAGKAVSGAVFSSHRDDGNR